MPTTRERFDYRYRGQERLLETLERIREGIKDGKSAEHTTLQELSELINYLGERVVLIGYYRDSDSRQYGDEQCSDGEEIGEAGIVWAEQQALERYENQYP